MRFSVLLAALMVAVFAASMHAEETTREDFREFCRTWEGRWVGDVTWIADWPGMGKKGEKVTAYWDARVTEDGNALVGKFYGGTGSSTHLAYFDPDSKQINWLWIESGGRVVQNRMYKKDGKWVQQGSAVNPDGAKTQYVGTAVFTDNSNTHTWTGSGTVDGKKTAEQHDVWRRVGK
ncbi:MAG: hypothetical protein GXY83_38870 [Rhodopirellula sp.]|nr:hypothetical protein [Rhodopirellula sp.]